MKIYKQLSIVRKVALSLIIILTVYLITICPGSNQLIQRIIPPSDNISGRKWDQPMRIRVYTTYLLCGHQERVIYNNPSQRFIKEVISPFEQHSDYKIRRGRKLIYRIQKRNWCPSCNSHQFLGINDQNVIVRYGTPIKPGPVREILHINVNQLPNSEREDLMRGIRFTDNKEKLQIIEGLSEMMGKP